jgi:hypothetical protein
MSRWDAARARVKGVGSAGGAVELPAGVLVFCGCNPGNGARMQWLVVPADGGRPCWACAEPLRRVEPPECGTLPSHSESGLGGAETPRGPADTY